MQRSCSSSTNESARAGLSFAIARPISRRSAKALSVERPSFPGAVVAELQLSTETTKGFIDRDNAARLRVGKAARERCFERPQFDRAIALLLVEFSQLVEVYALPWPALAPYWEPYYRPAMTLDDEPPAASIPLAVFVKHGRSIGRLGRGRKLDLAELLQEVAA